MAAAYGVAAILNVYLSRGANTAPFRWLFTHVAPMRAFRVPARFGMLLGLVLSVLSGYAVARLTRGRSRAITTLIVAWRTRAIGVRLAGPPGPRCGV